MKKGFTLIEIIIGIGIIGVFISITYPSYQHYLTRSRRVDGQSALLDLTTRMEQFYAENNTYASARIGSGSQYDILGSSISPEKWYTLSIINATETSYLLQAMPRGAQARLDTQCQSLVVNHLGDKEISNGPAGKPTSTALLCWR